MLRTNIELSASLVFYLLSDLKKYQDKVTQLLTFNAEQRLARVLLQLAQLDKEGPPLAEVPNLSQQILAEMIGTARARVNCLLNAFKKQGYINYYSYGEGFEVRKSLYKVLRKR